GLAAARAGGGAPRLLAPGLPLGGRVLAALVVVVLPAVVALEQPALVAGAEDVGDVEVGLALDGRPEVDEGRLHPRKDPAHPRLVDVSGDPSLAGALEEVLDQDPGLQDAQPRLGPLGAHHQLVVRHAGSSKSCGRRRARVTWMSRSRPGWLRRRTVR